MLEIVKLALRITTDAFDDQVQLLIDDCILSMNKLGVTAATAETNDPQIISAVISYCGWKFGKNDERDTFKRDYDEKLAELKMQTGYTTW